MSAPRFSVVVVYNGVEKPFNVEPHERVEALWHQAIAAFGTHALTLYRQDGTEINPQQSIEAAGIKEGAVLILRPHTVRGG